MDVRKIRRVYFIGAGGIGMSALARFFNQQGTSVCGYDKTSTNLTKKLETEGINLHYTDDVNLLDKEAELVVFTPAIPQDCVELNWYKSNGYSVFKRSDVLQWITEKMFAITVAGTHGKTTISTMTAYLLRETGYGCNAFLGGVAANYQSNYWSSENDTAVIEADEYDRSFLKLFPDVAILTSMDADHLDIYGTHEEVQKAFVQYTQNIKPNGTLLLKHGLPTEGMNVSNLLTYSLQNDAADFYGANIMQQQGGYQFDFCSKDVVIENIRLDIGGMHNVENMIAAIATSVTLNIDTEKIKAVVAGYTGVKRRFEYIVKNDETVYIDDYAHHPEELATLIKSAKKLFAGKKCVIIFQPHLFSRTRDFADGFAHSLDLADEVILLDIYPARELPIEGITAKTIAEKMNNAAHTILSKEGVLEYVKTAKIELLITAGAGDIDRLINPIKDILLNK